MPENDTTTTDEAPEEWRVIPGYVGLYEVSDLGRVRSLDRMETVPANVNSREHVRVRYGRVCRLNRRAGGYVGMVLCKRGTERGFDAHRLVLLAFMGPPPAAGYHACHFNGDPTDNRLGNLRWASVKENAQDRIRHGTQTRGELQPNAKLTDAIVAEARRLYTEGATTPELARRFGVSDAGMYNALSGRTWKHVPCAAQMRSRGYNL